MVSKCRCDNECLYCNDYIDDYDYPVGKKEYCDYSSCILTKDRKFFVSVVGCVSYIRR